MCRNVCAPWTYWFNQLQHGRKIGQTDDLMRARTMKKPAKVPPTHPGEILLHDFLDSPRQPERPSSHRRT